jgi:CRP-like cAMP-binding protein
VATTNLLRKLGGFFPVRDELRTDIEALGRHRVELNAGEALIRTGEKNGEIHLVEEGWMLRMRHTPDGGRQIVNVGLPGDFLNFTTLMFGVAQFDIVAKTPALLWCIQTETFREMMARHPGLAEALVWSNAHEESLLAERVVSLGRRDATQRLAHVLCELAVRLALIDRRPDGVLTIPLIQEDFADILGISVIHVVRTFKRLSEIGAVDYRSRRLIVRDMGKLQEAAGFEGEYLYFSQRRDARMFIAK